MLPEPEPVEGVFLTKREDGYAINYQHHLVNSTSMSYIVRDALPSEDATIAVLYHNAFVSSFSAREDSVPSTLILTCSGLLDKLLEPSVSRFRLLARLCLR